MRGLAEQAESTESERFKEPTGPLLSAREVSPRTELPDEEALKRRDRGSPSGQSLFFSTSLQLLGGKFKPSLMTLKDALGLRPGES